MSVASAISRGAISSGRNPVSWGARRGVVTYDKVPRQRMNGRGAEPTLRGPMERKGSSSASSDGSMYGSNDTADDAPESIIIEPRMTLGESICSSLNAQQHDTKRARAHDRGPK